MGVPAAEELAVLFLRANTSVILLVFVLISAVIKDETLFSLLRNRTSCCAPSLGAAKMHARFAASASRRT
jgi:hypothetical protein